MMRLIKARRMRDEAVLSVHLDTTKVDGQGDPDPDYVVTRTWVMPPRQGGETAQQYATRVRLWVDGIKADMKEHCTALLAVLQDREQNGVVIPGEGQEF